MPIKASSFHLVRGIHEYSLCDWPGRVSCVLFVGGCNARCPTCHNAQLAWHPNQLPVISADRIQAYLQRYGAWLDGIVVSGGEPTAHPQLPMLLCFLRQFRIPVKLDTNGLHPHILADLLQKELVQAVSVDIKGPAALYSRLCGITLAPERITKNFALLAELASGYKGFQFRITRVPLLEAAEKNDPTLMDSIHALLPPQHILHIQEYQPIGASHAYAS